MTYIVKEGDTLYKIAKVHGMTLKKLLEFNPDINNPNLIFPGQQILLRDAKEVVTVTPQNKITFDVVGFYQKRGWRISSDYGIRKDPFTGKNNFHRGIDFAGKSIGEPIYTPVEGKIIYSSHYNSWGNLIGIQDKKGFIHLFAHLDKRAKSIGDMVSIGEVIGNNGSTGNSTAPHLHYQINTPRGGIIGINAHTDPRMFRY